MSMLVITGLDLKIYRTFILGDFFWWFFNHCWPCGAVILAT